MSNIYLAIPQYKAMPEAESKRICQELGVEPFETPLKGSHPMFELSVAQLFKGKHRIKYGVIKGDGNLPRARMLHLGYWKKDWDTGEKCEYFMIMDDDISFPDDALDILIEDDKPIVGGIYTFKTKKEEYAGKPCTRFMKVQHVYDDRPFEVQWLNGGFILVKAEVLLHMIEAYPELTVDFPREQKTEVKETWALWCPMVYQDDGQRLFLAEDWSFCERARRLGYGIWADMRVKLFHWEAENGYGIHL